MSDRPTGHVAETNVEIPAPQLVPAGKRISKEQLAAAERTREYHLRKLQGLGASADRSGDGASPDRALKIRR